MSDNKALDILGIKPIGDAINTTVTKSFEGLEGFLKLVCAPALEEVGLLMKDQVRHWRLNNVMKILEKAHGKIEFKGNKLEMKAHPRVALSIIENGSLIDNDEVQQLWAGLFVSSCTKDGQDDENLIFVDLLKQLTVLEARIINYVCLSVQKVEHASGLIVPNTRLFVKSEELFEITGLQDLHRIDRELDHLKSLDLIGGQLSGGFNSGDSTLTADITPTALALNLYIKTQGYNGNPVEFWKDNIVTYETYEQLRKERIAKEQEQQKAQMEQMEKQRALFELAEEEIKAEQNPKKKD